ncbi:uncharacterized protein UTRI_04645_B [Ustilago trichophora]|uniref:Phospholipid/glycerol acyltransferase domain-containing protein n=1 Tax=Ustilago trichophora TaxID=86804 RepID=A0A5C3EEY3_9BASI|nr:uncharacterized protein UTRI_04645_B [Ustilago trichophora]
MAEKFSKFRDPGTGIQVFLTPVAASTSSSSSWSGSFSIASVIFTPVFILLGLIRAIVGGLFWGMYLISGNSALLRVVLGALGFISLAVERVSPGTSGRSAGGRNKQDFNKNAQEAKKGDLVMANHSSYFDLLILAYLYPGLKFVLPVIGDGVKEEMGKYESTSGVGAGASARRTPKKNAMSANTRIVTPSSASATSSSSSTEIPILGYVILPLSSALRFIGALPPSQSQLSTLTIHQDLNSTLKSSSSPLAFFPEVVTSNNRALLTVPTLPSSPPEALKATHIVTLKYAPPTTTSTTSVYSVPSAANSITRHLANVVFLSNPLRSVAIRQATMAKMQEQTQNWPEDVVGFMSSMARLKRTSIAWWTKREFLIMVQGRNRRV